MTALIARALPLLNKAIPMGLASQGLAKIDPRLKRFIQSSIASGYSLDTILEYLRDKAQGNKTPAEDRVASGMARPDEMASAANLQQGRQPINTLQNMAVAGAAGGAGLAALGGLESLMGGNEQQAIQPSEVMPAEDQGRMLGQQQQMQQLQGPPPEQPMQAPEGPIPMGSKGQAPMVGNVLNLLASYDQELADVVGAQMGQGADAQQLANYLKKSSRFKGPISRLEKDTVSSFEKLLSSLMNFQKPKTREEALGAFRQKMMNRNAMQGQQAPQQQQQSGVNEALMAAINKIMSM
jgi:hypothetical protein